MMLNNAFIQIQFLFSMLVTAGVVLGLGTYCRSLTVFKTEIPSTSIQGAFGILLLGLLSLLFNFFMPLNLAFFCLISGLAIAGLYLGKVSLRASDLSYLALIIIIYWMLGVRAPPASDTGLYHVPIIHWMHESALPFGLANLHDRFATWNFWFSVCGGISAGNLLPYSCFSVTAVLVSLLCLDLAKVLFQQAVSKPAIGFTLATFLIYFFLESWRFLHGQKSPDADFAGSILMVWATFHFIRRNEGDFFVFSSILLSGIAILVKLNQLPLALIPLFFAYSYYRNGKLLKLISLFLILLVPVVLMLLKSFVVSGCLLFPMVSSCVLTDWSLPIGHVDYYQRLVKSWARHGGLPPDQVLGNWNWLPQWVEAMLKERIFHITFFSVFAWMTAVVVKGYSKFKLDLITLMILNIALVYWFSMAPDLRFGYGILVSLIGVILGPVLAYYFKEKWSKPLIRVTVFYLLFLCFGQIRRADDLGAATLVDRTPIYEVKYNRKGQPFLNPKENECWTLPLPCVVNLEPNLIQSTRFGRLAFILEESKP